MPVEVREALRRTRPPEPRGRVVLGAKSTATVKRAVVLRGGRRAG